MTLPEFWHLITTSRYTRLLETTNAELRAEIKQLRLRIGRSLAETATAGYEGDDPLTAPPARRGRPGRFLAFSADKRRLENQREPPQRSVNV